MRIGFVLFVVSAAIVSAAVAADEDLTNEDSSQDLGTLAFEPKGLPYHKDQGELLREGCSTGKACQRRSGTCISSIETCRGQVVDRGCGDNCTCCVIEAESCGRKQACKQANGFCVKESGSCTGSIIAEGCTGTDCVCCINDNNCPNGFFRLGTECFKVFQQFARWDEARHICKSQGWELAEPDNLQALAEFIYTKVSHYYFWIGSRGIGDSFKYLSGQSLQDDAPWGLGYPSDMTSVGDCLILRSTNTSYMTSLAATDCYNKYYFLCEPACPKGFIKSGSGCFKPVIKAQNWENSEKNCYEDKLQIAEPEDPKNLAKLLYDGIGGTRYTRNTFWLGARGGRINGSMMAWNSGDVVPSPHPINNTWHPTLPRYNTSAYCLVISTSYYTVGPLYGRSCTAAYYSICELICPLGFFHIGNQCYKAFSTGASSWDEAREICNQEHLTLAEPQDPTAMAHYLSTVTGHRNYWLGGRGDGNGFRWSAGEALPNNWAPWLPGSPGNKVGTNYCLSLTPEHRTTPLTTTKCNTKLYPLCE
ncbi:unnamed protein product [Meganyctiphanes norvegica]|uniref:C-type lectin domain-containing protein n=1 Tax=Meganyctiphanes norvegica TaxID=48144 RepID=A0AAV2PTE2_MEGNR